jgi:hypothetical protein
LISNRFDATGFVFNQFAHRQLAPLQQCPYHVRDLAVVAFEKNQLLLVET